MADAVVIGILILASVLALRSVIRDKKNGKGCCGDCSKCGKNCKK